MSGRLSLSLSGAFRATGDGKPITGISARGQVLIAYLATHPDRRARREDLAALLWGDRGEEQARASLRQELSVLRRLLPEEALRADRTGVWLEADRIERADEAGTEPFLAGLSLRAPAVEDWLRDMRLRDTAERTARAVTEAEEHLARSDPATASRHARDALALDPCSEPALRAAMRAEDAADNRAGALALFEQVRARLAADLDAEPGQETLSLAQSLRGKREAPPARPSPARTADRPILAVLPFDELGAAQEDMFADGIVEEITGALSRIRDFDVIARQSAFALRGQGLDHAETAARLGASYLVEGSVRRSGDRVRIAVQLVDGSDGRTLWSERFDDRMDDLFDLQDRIAAQTAGQISPSLRKAEIARARSRPPADRTAYELTLSALPHFWAHRASDNMRAIELLRQALDHNPGNARAMAYKAWCHAHQCCYIWTRDGAADKAEALNLFERAAPLVQEDPAAQVALSAAISLAGDDFPQAKHYVERALALDPNNAWGWLRMGWTSIYLAEFDAAFTAFDRYDQLSPLDPFHFNGLFGRAAALRATHRYDEAIALIEEGMREGPGVTWAYRMLFATNWLAGNKVDAMRAAKKWREAYPGVTWEQVKDLVVSKWTHDEEYARVLRKLWDIE